MLQHHQEQQEHQQEPSNDGYNASEESTDEEFEPPIITQPYRFPPHTPGRPMRFRFNSALQPTVYTNFFQVPINRSNSLPNTPPPNPFQDVPEPNQQHNLTQQEIVNNLRTSTNNIINIVSDFLNQNQQGQLSNVPRMRNRDVVVVSDETELKNLNEIEYQQSSKINSSCMICMDEFKDDDKVLDIKCKHNFHTKCINEWLSKHSNKCPICKTELTKSRYLNL